MYEWHDDCGRTRVRFQLKDGSACVRGCEIYTFGVESGRGQGTGTALLKEVEAHMRSNGCRRAWYYATPRDEYFWKKMGYRRPRKQWFKSQSWWMYKTL